MSEAMSADREPTAVEVIAGVIEERFLDRSLDVWPDFTPEAESVVERIRAMTPVQQAEILGVPVAKFRLARSFAPGLNPARSHRVESADLMSQKEALALLRSLGSPYRGRVEEDRPRS